MSSKRKTTISLQRKISRSTLRVSVLAALATLSAAGCTGKTIRIGPDDGGAVSPNLSSQDFRSVAMRMARSLIAHPAIKDASSPPRVALLKLENQSDDYEFNGAMFLSRIQVALTKNSGGRIIFLDRGNIGAIDQENQDKRDGLRQSRQSAIPHGAEYFLSGELGSITQNAGKSSTYFYQFVFRLTDAATSEVVWSDEYSIHKASLRGIMQD